MRHGFLASCTGVAALLVIGSPNDALAQATALPHDGMFHIEARPAFQFKATLREHWVSPRAGAGSLDVFAPLLPELPGQRNVSTRLVAVQAPNLKAEEIAEEGSGARRFLALHVKSDALPLKDGITLALEYQGVLCARSLKWGRPAKAVPALTAAERRQYLMASTTMDYGAPEFAKWVTDQGLTRKSDEDVMRFAHRVFTYLVKHGKYGGDTSSYESRRPSRVCASVANDCGGLALLFVAVLRTNGVPGRTLFGRWAIPQTDAYGQYHVMAEFFVDGSGWVPVDVAGTIVHRPANPNALFGNTDGQHLAFHVDTDLEPARGFRHAWAQYLLLRWSGSGDFSKDSHVDSKWIVNRVALAGRLGGKLEEPGSASKATQDARKAQQEAKRREEQRRRKLEEARKKAAGAKLNPQSTDEEASRQLKLARVFLANGAVSTARTRLQAIVRDYPETSAAKQASTLLEKLQK
jgi:hypothetical protein